MLVAPLRDERLTVGTLALHVVQWGEQGSPIVCVHGLTANAFFFQSLVDKLSPSHHIIAYDLRGRGDSDKPRSGYSVPIHAADLHALLEVLHVEQPILIGHSLGALIALYYAAHYPTPLRKLVLIDAGAPLPWSTPEEQPAWLSAAVNRLGTPVPSFDTYTQNLKSAPFLGPYWNRYMDVYFQHDVYHCDDGSVVARAYRDGIIEEGQRYFEAEPERQWPNVYVPTLLLRAGQGMFSQDDQLLSSAAAAQARRMIPNCRLINYPSLNHYTIVLDQRRRAAQAIATFLNRE
jgi:pimeloyl-ACP methyl ester carboxylesterase